MSAARVVLGFAVLIWLVTLVQLIQTPLSAWQIRPAITCEQGTTVHQTGVISANRVNIRALPTVFSDVIQQVNEGHPVVAVCQFGAWIQIAEPNTDAITWVSRGLVLLDETPPLSAASRVGLIASLLLSMAIMAIASLRPHGVNRAVFWLMQTGDLPEYAKPLISNTKRDSATQTGTPSSLGTPELPN